jgi:hypothetical protein
MLAAGFLALAGALDWPTAALILASLGVRVATLAGESRLLLPAKWAPVLALASVVFYPLDERFVSESLARATVHLACLLAVIKILSARTPRDYAWVQAIAFLEVVAAALVSATPGFLGFLAVFLACALTAYTTGEILESMREGASGVTRETLRAVPGRVAVFSGALFAAVLTMTAGMFYVLPRTARAAVARFLPQRQHLPGFSTQVALGEIGEIKRTSTPVMHVRPFGEGTLGALRWRGAALTHFDGKRWFNPAGSEELLRADRGAVTLREGRTSPGGRAIQYQVQLARVAGDTLFFAGRPQTVSINAGWLRRTEGGAIRVNRLPTGGLRYGVFAILEDERVGPTTSPEPLGEAARYELLAVPRLDRRMYRLAREMAAGAATQEEEARAIEQRLKRDYGYTLELPKSAADDPLAQFLFERRKGHCEYFASAMAVMLRMLGVPSRVATGFLGGTYNPLTGWQVIRTSDAHSWVEAWIDGRGWMSFDPTPPDPAAPNELLGGMALLADAAGQFWQDWVLSYDLERQVVLAARIGRSGASLPLEWLDRLGARAKAAADAWAVALLWMMGAAGVGIGAALFGGRARARIARWLRVRRVQRGEAQASDATLLYTRMLDALEKRGFRKPAWVTPAEFAGMVARSEVGALVAGLTHSYNQCRFGGRREEAPRMLELLERIERGKR